MSPRVLVVENDTLQGMVHAAILRDMGLEALGPVPSVSRALVEINASCPDLVLLDHHLADGPACLLSYALRATGVPFIWVTGCYPEELPPGDAPILEKPFDLEVLKREIAAMLEGPSAGWRSRQLQVNPAAGGN